MRQVAVLSVVLVVALTGSYLTWTADDSAPEQGADTKVFAAAPADLQGLSWESQELSVSVERRSDG